MKKIVISVAVASLLVTASLQSAAFSDGKVSGQIKAMHILSDNTNGFAPENGSGYLATLKYVTPAVYKGLKFGAAFYANGDTSFTKWDEADNKPANGMFTSPRGETNALLGQAYLEYKNKHLFVRAGRQILNTPLTKIKWSLMPNFYEAAILKYKATPSLSLSVSHINAMSYGSRSTTDWGLIGEGTGTAGSSQKPVNVGGKFEQAKFHNIGTAGGVERTDGMTAANISYNMSKNLKLSLWDYYAHDIANMIYADVSYKMPVMKGTALTLQAQYLDQSNIGKDLKGDLDFSMYGAKAKIGNKNWSAYLAYNASNDSDSNKGFLNTWGSDPAYTSSLFSRNQYRDNVSAYKIGGHYVITKGLKFLASYANYGKSQTLFKGSKAALNDATEIDIILAYKPLKALTLKIFNTIRVSEYDEVVLSGKVKDREMNHFRVIAAYKF